MKLKGFILVITAILFGNISAMAQSDRQDLDTACLTKTSSEWASDCELCLNDSKSYRVNLQNICERHIDVRLAVQEKTLRWKIFNFNNLAPGDTLSGYACEGTGKYVFWTRTANDASIMFPSENEIESQFNR